MKPESSKGLGSNGMQFMYGSAMGSAIKHAIDNLKEGNYSRSVQWLDIALNDISTLRQRIIELDNATKDGKIES